jgi:hypothetical protein
MTLDPYKNKLSAVPLELFDEVVNIAAPKTQEKLRLAMRLALCYGYTQTAAAKKCGVSRSAVCQSISKLSRSVIKKRAQFLPRQFEFFDFRQVTARKKNASIFERMSDDYGRCNFF